MSKKETLKDAGYKYIAFSRQYGWHILENDCGDREIWVANKDHASYGLIWRNTHLEFMGDLWA